MYTKTQETINSWLDLQFGLFIHFGLFSLPGGCWNGKQVTRGYSEQILSHGYIPQADYEKLTKEFALKAFDARAIVRLAKEAGMKYLVLVSKHHDGFCLFGTQTTDYSSINSACKLDIVRSFSDACREEGLKFGLYFSWIDWHFPQALPISPHNSDLIPSEHQAYNIQQLTELLSNYGPICELWMDMGAPTIEQSRQVYELAARLQPDCMINGRIWNDFGDFLTMGDNQLPEVHLDGPWQTPASIYKETWGYRSWQQRGDLESKIAELSDTARHVVQRGGNYLLNIGLMGDGSVQAFEEQVLRGMGKNLAKNPLQRPKAGQDSDSINNATAIKIGKTTNLGLGTAYYRYTGAEYYTYRSIPTSLNWEIETATDAVYTVQWQTLAPLKQEIKLCFATQTGTKKTQANFTLQRERKSDTITEQLALKAGHHRLSLSTIGEPLKRAELTQLDLSLVLKETLKK